MEKKQLKDDNIITYAPKSEGETMLTKNDNTCVSSYNSDLAKGFEAVGKVANAAPKVAKQISRTDTAYANSNMDSTDKREVLVTREKEKTKRIAIGGIVLTLVVGILTLGRVNLKHNS